eukprot:6200085-Pleurochrysis_carterae.AAC.4
MSVDDPREGSPCAAVLAHSHSFPFCARAACVVAERSALRFSSSGSALPRYACLPRLTRLEPEATPRGAPQIPAPMQSYCI